MSSKDCLDKCSKDCFSVSDTANTKYQLRIKESHYITWLKHILNKQKPYQDITHKSKRNARSIKLRKMFLKILIPP